MSYQSSNGLVKIFRGRSMSSENDNSESEACERSPLVSSWSLAKLLIGKRNSFDYCIESSPKR